MRHHPGVRWLAGLVTALCIGCGGGGAGGATPTQAPTPPVANDLVYSGAVQAHYQGDGAGIEGRPVCGGSLSGRPHSINFVLGGVAGNWLLRIEVGVASYQRPGTFEIGPFPDGTSQAPAIVNVNATRQDLRGPLTNGVNYFAWVSGSGKMTVHPGQRSGTVAAHLTSLDTPEALDVNGTWACPPSA